MAIERPRVLILGGTAEARALAVTLTDAGLRVLSSLAGRVREPALPAGEIRIGGFGGSEGLADFLRARQFAGVVDATHPFAVQMSTHAAQACRATGTPLLRLARTGWSADPAAGGWTWVSSNSEALEVIRADDRVLLTIGRQGLADFLPLGDRHVVARVVEEPDIELPPRWQVLRSRGPYALAEEIDLMRSRRTTVLVTKDSGGDHTRAKLDAAAEVGTRIVVIARPSGPSGVRAVASVREAADWVLTGAPRPER